MRARVIALGALLVAACGGSPSSSSGSDAAAGGDAATGGTGGPVGACTSCFGHGHWSIDNIEPCFVSGADATTVTLAISSVESGAQVQCPTDFSAAPPTPWSKDTLTIDCAGHYRLCYTLKAGAPANPGAGDCVVAQSCAEGDAEMSASAQAWPDLPSWITTSSETACAQRFYDGGGYGEESVTGTPTGCAPITKTFGRVTYCPLSCNGPNPPAVCAGCQAGGGGAF